MRLTYNKKFAVLQEDLTIKFENEIFDFNKGIDIAEHGVKNYRDFLDTIYVFTRNNKNNGSYYILTNDDKSVVVGYAQSGDNTIKLVVQYDAEDSIKYIEYLRKLVGIKFNEGRVIFAKLEANYNFITSPTILNILFTRQDILLNKKQIVRQFQIKKSNGKMRDIAEPNEALMPYLRDLNEILQSKYDYINSDFQVAYKKGKSVKDAAKVHVNKNFVYAVDIKDFFPSCTKELVRSRISFFFNGVPNRKFIENELLDSILLNDALYIGNPISGVIANNIVSKPFYTLKRVCQKNKMEFSAYADDIFFSSDRRIYHKFIENLIDNTFIKHGLDTTFNVNHSKSRGMSNQRRHITGVTINHKNHMTPNQAYTKELRVMLHKLSLNKQRESIEEIKGKLAYATMVDDSGKIYRMLEKFNTTVEKYKLVSEETIETLKSRIVGEDNAEISQ